VPLQKLYQDEDVKVNLQQKEKTFTLRLEWPDGGTHSLDVIFDVTLFGPVSDVLHA
jgi:hypothetical protein